MNEQNNRESSTPLPPGIIRSSRSSAPAVDIEPWRLLGHVVQVALSKDQQSRPTRLVPPLKVISYSLAKGKPEDRYGPDTYFIGEPLQSFLVSREFRESFSYVSDDTLFMFFSNLENMQPQFCLNPLFLTYLQREGESIPVEVYTASRQVLPETPGYASSVDEYKYLDFGVLQLFVPGKGFLGRWPQRYPNKEELNRIEQLLIDDRNLVSSSGGKVAERS